MRACSLNFLDDLLVRGKKPSADGRFRGLSLADPWVGVRIRHGLRACMAPKAKSAGVRVPAD